MMCYKDRTYCSYWTSCKEGSTCTRALTEDVAKDAKASGMLISQFAGPPPCYIEKGKLK